MSESKETGHSPKFKSKMESAQIISSIWNVFRRNMPRRDIGKTAIRYIFAIMSSDEFKKDKHYPKKNFFYGICLFCFR